MLPVFTGSTTPFLLTITAKEFLFFVRDTFVYKALCRIYSDEGIVRDKVDDFRIAYHNRDIQCSSNDFRMTVFCVIEMYL